MLKRIRECFRDNKGFTMMEMIAAITVIIVIGTIVTVAVYGYSVTAYMMKANQTAKTIFFAAQSYVNQEKEIGAIEEFNKKILASNDTFKQNIDMSNILDTNKYFGNGDEKETWKNNHSNSNIVAIKIDTKTESRDSLSDTTNSDYNPFYSEIVEPNIKDENITDHCFLMEYDVSTGVVLGVFYTEKIDSFSNASYDANYITEKNNVIMRDADSLQNKRQGYYGVNMSNYANNLVTTNPPTDVRLVNSERLYLEWKEPENPIALENGTAVDPGTNLESVIYKIEIKSKKTDGLLGTVKTTADRTNLNSEWAEAEGIANGLNPSVSSSPVFIYDKDTKTYALLLDCIHSSILERYPGIKSTDMLYCEITTEIVGAASDGSSVQSNTESANFGGGEDKRETEDATIEFGGSGNVNEDGKEENPFTIKYARHLNNMRNVTPDSNFVQKGDIDWQFPETNNDSDNTKIENKEYFEPLVFVEEVFAVSEGKIPTEVTDFRGSYISQKNQENADKGNYSISGIKIKVDIEEKGYNVGLFSINSGKIDGIKLINSSVIGYSNVGAIAGRNDGQISNVDVEASVSGKLSEIQEDTQKDQQSEPVSGQNIGGIIGENNGTAEELSTLPKKNEKTGTYTQNTVTGTSNVGGVIGVNKSEKAALLTNYNNVGILVNGKNRSEEKKSEQQVYQNFGGIAGYNYEDAKLKQCVNKGLINLNIDIDEDTRPAIEYIGGVAGQNQGSILSCSSVLDDTVLTGSDDLLKACIEGLNKADGKLPDYLGIGVGGIAGYHYGDKAVIQDCRVDNAVVGERLVGGLVGINMASVSNSGASAGTGQDEDVSGLVIGSGSMVGGIFGYVKPDIKVGNYSNSSNVFGKSLTGGITGIYGAVFDNLEDLKQMDWDQTLDNLSADNEKNYNLLKNQSLTAEKRKEIQDSFSRYYTELIKGAPDSVKIQSDNPIKNCKNTGFIFASKRYSGGITGVNFGEIDSCSSNYEQVDGDLINSGYSNLATADCVGGIAGLNKGSIIGKRGIVGEKNNNVVYGSSFVGGIVGWNVGEVNEYRSFSGSVIGKRNYVGGYMGMNSVLSSIDNTEILYNSGKDTHVTGENYVGGIIGCNVVAVEADKDVNIIASTGAGIQIEGEAYVGGILGYHSCVQTLENVPAQCSELTVQYPYSSFDANFVQTELDKLANTSVFKQCTNNANVEGVRYVGGIIGYNQENSKLKVQNCTNLGSITQNSTNTAIAVEPDKSTPDGIEGTSYFIGGITGRNTAGSIINNCYNDGSVKSSSKYLGGLCEVNEGEISECYLGQTKSFTVEGKSSVGGITGLNRTAVAGSTATVKDCRANQYSSIIGGSNTGGLVGTNMAVVSGCKTYANIYADEGDRVGGMVGFNMGVVSSSTVGDATIRPLIQGRDYVGGLIGVNHGTILEDDSETVSADNSQKVISDLTNYANVSGKSYLGGIVGSHDSEQIINCVNYGNITSEVKNANNNVIGSGYAGGITGVNEAKKMISDCSNYGDVTSNYSNAGGIVGINYGSINKCNNEDGKIQSNNSQAGGIAGISSGTIKSCVNKGSVAGSTAGNGKDTIGGIVGTNEIQGIVENCVSEKNTKGTNAIIGSSVVGGVVGWNQGKILWNESNKSRENSIDIRVERNVDNAAAEYITYIGGIVGKTEYKENVFDTLSNFVYSGSIQVQSAVFQQQYIGGIVSNVPEKITVKNCEFRGKIEGFGNAYRYYDDKGNSLAAKAGGVGGITGSNKGTIYLNKVDTSDSSLKNAYGVSSVNTGASSSVEGQAHVGGIVGEQTASGKFKYNNQTADGSRGTDEFIFNNISVSGKENVGGIIGKNYNSLDSYKNMGKVKGYKSAGGIVGLQNTPSELTNLENSLSASIILAENGSSQIGGIIGNAGGATLKNCRNLGQIKPEDKSTVPTGVSAVGGIAGFGNLAVFIDCVNGDPISRDNTPGGITGDASLVGGIVGNYQGVKISKTTGSEVDLSSIKTEFKGCSNYGSISITSSGTRGIGGIIGNAYGSNEYVTMDKCDNYADISVLGKSSYSLYDGNNGIGGIAGIMNTRARMENCYNNGAAITAPNYAQVGGILGSFKSTSTSYFTGLIYKCEAKAQSIISGGGDVGGIIGRQENVEGVTVSDCINYGVVRGDQNIGGITGDLYNGTMPAGSSGGYFKCNNGKYAKVVRTETVKLNEGTGIGGCIGRNNSTDMVFSQLENNGTIEIEKNTRNVKISEVGGIVGTAGNGTFRKCINQSGAQMDFSKVNQKILDLGGIAGRVKSTGTNGLYGCENRQTIIANELSENVGGVAGELELGTISSCVNIKTASQKIVGGTRVGGIAGKVSGVSSKIISEVETDTSETQKKFNGSYNSMDVQGLAEVGGIAGELSGSALISLYNSGKVTVERSVVPKDTISAGGIVGKSAHSASSQNQGTIINCYNLGNVGWSDDKDAASDVVSGYIGGIIGYRDYKTSESKWADRTSGGATVRDCYFVDSRIAQTRPVDNAQNRVMYNAWMIGNEPFDKFTNPNNDSQSFDSYKTGEKGYWSEEVYEKMLEIVGLDVPWNSKNELANMNTILQNYFYTLPVPGTKEVTGVSGTNYFMKWSGQLGLTSGYRVAIYTACDETGKKGVGAPIWTKEYMDVNSVLEGVPMNLDSILSKYIGQPLYVSIQALGFSVGTGDSKIDITLDSKDEIVQSFVMMPYLPKVPLEAENDSDAKLEITQKPGTAEVTLKISNVKEYLKGNPIDDYPALGALSNGKLLSEGLYDSYLNGLMEKNGKMVIYVMDYDLTSDKPVEDWRKTPRELVVDLEKNEATRTIDYSKESSYAEGRYFHVYRLQDKISDEQEQQTLKPDANGNVKFRYLSSDQTEMKYLISTTKKLTAPTDLKASFIGNRTDSENDTQIKLEWKNPAEGKETVKGYRITIQNPVTNQEYVIEESISTGIGYSYSYTLSPEEIKRYMEGTTYPAYDSKADTLKWKVTAISDGRVDANKVTYTDSEKDGPDMNVPLQTKPVQNMTAQVSEPIFYPNIIDFNWSDDSYTEGTTSYVLKTQGTSGNTDVSGEVNLMSRDGKTCRVSVPVTLIKDYDVVLTVLKKGELGKSLDSVAVPGSIKIKKSLQQVEALSVLAPEVDSEDSSRIKLGISWTIPKEISAGNCGGYMIAAIQGENQVLDTMIIGDCTVNTAEMKLDIGQIDKDFILYVYAIGKEGISSASRGTSYSVIMPENRLTAPENIKLKVLKADDSYLTEDSYICTREELSALRYEFNWTNIAAEASKIKGIRFKVKDSEGALAADKEINDSTVTQANAKFIYAADLSAYAGKTLTVEMINLSNSVSALGSQIAVTTIQVPKVKLAQPSELSVKMYKTDGSEVTQNEQISQEEFAHLSYTIAWKNVGEDVGKIKSHVLKFWDGTGDMKRKIALSDGSTEKEADGMLEEIQIKFGDDILSYPGETIYLEIENTALDESESNSEPLFVQIPLPQVLKP